MATDGKRTIFQDQEQLHAIEGEALGDIRPGALVAQAAGGLDESAQAATVFGAQPLFADYNFLQAGDVDTDWPEGSWVVARQLPSNKIANVLVAAGQNITARGTALASNGDGTLKIAETDGTEQVLCYADEIINTGASATLVRVRGA